jgi:hypothetical protein
MKVIRELVLVFVAQVVMGMGWITAQVLVDKLARLLSDSPWVSFFFTIPVVMIGAILYFVGLRLVVGVVYNVGNGRGPKGWLRALLQSVRMGAKVKTLRATRG